MSEIVPAKPGMNLSWPDKGELHSCRLVGYRVHADNTWTPIGFEPMPDGAPWAITLAKGVIEKTSDGSNVATLTEWAAKHGVEHANGTRVLGKIKRIGDGQKPSDFKPEYLTQEAIDDWKERQQRKPQVELRRRRFNY